MCVEVGQDGGQVDWDGTVTEMMIVLENIVGGRVRMYRNTVQLNAMIMSRASEVLFALDMSWGRSVNIFFVYSNVAVSLTSKFPYAGSLKTTAHTRRTHQMRPLIK
jgi:hypothetical protein